MKIFNLDIDLLRVGDLIMLPCDWPSRCEYAKLSCTLEQNKLELKYVEAADGCAEFELYEVKKDGTTGV